MLEFPFVVCGGCGRTIQEGRPPVSYQLCDDCQVHIASQIVDSATARYVVAVSILGTEHRVGFNDAEAAGAFYQWCISRGYTPTAVEREGQP